MKKVTLSIMVIGLFALVLAFSSSVQAAGWYGAEVVHMITRVDTGNIIIQVEPGATEDRFTERSRLSISADNAGCNKSLALILTAISMDKEIVVYTENVPSWSTQGVSSVSLDLTEE